MNGTDKIKYKLLDSAPEAQFQKAHETDAGYDLRSADAGVLRVGQSALFSTGLILQLPAGFTGIIKSRSGLAAKSGVEVGAGVVDSGYRGQVMVLLHNFGSKDLEVRRGDRIAQMCVVRLYDGPCERVDALDAADRGDSGFGSTGV